MRFGKNKGCAFIKDKCVNNYEINPEFENEFFDSIYMELIHHILVEGQEGHIIFVQHIVIYRQIINIFKIIHMEDILLLIIVLFLDNLLMKQN